MQISKPSVMKVIHPYNLGTYLGGASTRCFDGEGIRYRAP